MRGQQYLDVAPNELKGEVGGSVEATWTVFKNNQSDRIGSATLFLGLDTIPEKELYTGVLELTKQNLAIETFGERIEAEFKEPKYTVTLNSLNYTDIFTKFTLVMRIISPKGSPRGEVRSTVEITEVKGMYFSSFFFTNHFVLIHIRTKLDLII